MTRKVLDVGQCQPDHARIARLLQGNFEVEIQCANSRDQALELAAQGLWDLILINRILDADGDNGLEIVRLLKSDPRTSAIPVMLVSNFPDAQTSAVEAGAERGFGKQELDEPATVDRLREWLGQPVQ